MKLACILQRQEIIFFKEIDINSVSLSLTTKLHKIFRIHSRQCLEMIKNAFYKVLEVFTLVNFYMLNVAYHFLENIQGYLKNVE